MYASKTYIATMAINAQWTVPGTRLLWLTAFVAALFAQAAPTGAQSKLPDSPSPRHLSPQIPEPPRSPTSRDDVKPLPSQSPVAQTKELNPRPDERSEATHGFTVQDWTNFLIAAATIGSTITSVLMWIITRRSLQFIEQQMRLAESSVRAETSARITASHREIFLSFLDKPRLLDTLAAGKNIATEYYTRDLAATLLINHVFDVFQSARLKHVEESHWTGLQADIRSLMGWPIIKQRWKEVRAFYPSEFSEYIDSLGDGGNQVRPSHDAEALS